MTAAPFEQQQTSGTVCATCGEVHPRGRFVKGCPGPRLKSGLHSALVRSGELPVQAGARAMLAEREMSIVNELGGVDGLSVLARDLVGRYAALQLVESYLMENIIANGVLAKGRQRAALNALLQVSDRLTRMALALGLDRRVRALNFQERLATAFAAKSAREAKRTDEDAAL